jgi:hypothetical protein
MGRRAPLAACVLLVSCSDGGGHTDPDTLTIPDMTDPGVELASEVEGDCGSLIGTFSPAVVETLIVEDPDYPYWRVRGAITPTLTLFPRSFVDIWGAYGTGSTHVGPTEPGTYSIGDWRPGRPSPGDTCDLCVHMYENCPTEALGMCVDVYVATQGTLEIETIDLEPGGRFTATLTGLYFEEWDGHDVVDGGKSACIDLWEVDVTLEAG